VGIEVGKLDRNCDGIKYAHDFDSTLGSGIETASQPALFAKPSTQILPYKKKDCR
jgi:hypothetical protein